MTPLRKVGELLQEVIGPARPTGERQPLAFFRKVVERALPDEWACLSIERSAPVACACPPSSPRVGTT